MKIAFTLLLFVLTLIGLHLFEQTLFGSDLSSSKPFMVIEASLDRHLAFIIVTAGLVGVIKLKRNPG